jgi:hypothetical protein
MLVIVTSSASHLVSVNEHLATVAVSLAMTAFVSTTVACAVIFSFKM